MSNENVIIIDDENEGLHECYMEGFIHGWGSEKGKRNLGLLWGYFLQITFTWNKFMWEKLNSSILNNSCDNGEFSHSYIIVYQYFALYPKM